MILVIWGHLIERAAFSDATAAAAYSAIYLFHIPAFAMVSGMFARASLTVAACIRTGRTLILPLVVFQLLYWPFLSALAPERIGGLLTPHWILWFLLSLAGWRFLLPVFARLNAATSVALAVAIAIAAGFLEGIGHAFSLSRTLFFFPAYLVGYWIAHKANPAPVTPRVQSVLIFVGLTGAAAAAGLAGWDFTPLFGSMPYAALSDAPVDAALVRFGVIAAGLAAAWSLLAIIPDRTGLMTRLGRATLPVYLMHGFVVVVFWNLVPGGLGKPAWLFVLLCGALAFLIGLGLMGLAERWRLMVRRHANAAAPASPGSPSSGIR